MEDDREPGPLEKELDAAMQRGMLGTSLHLRVSTGGPDPASNMKRVEELFMQRIEIEGMLRRTILRLAREIDDLRAADD
jgi:hypothetical protein